MEEENNVGLTEISNEVLIDFEGVCRFCLSETKNCLSINEAFLSGEFQEEMKGESVCSFVRKLGFVKMEDSRSFPLGMCNNCHKVIQLCYDFGEMCKKSNQLLNDWHEENLKQIHKEDEKSEMETTTKNKSYNVTNTLVNNEINKSKKETTSEKQSESMSALNVYKQKLNSLSSDIKHVFPFKKSPDGNQHSCSECSLKFSSLNALNLHTCSHKRLKFQCKNCFRFFTDSQKLKKHYETIHKMTEIPEDYLNNTIRQIQQREKKKYFCFHCIPFKEFQSEVKLTQHLKNTHKTESLVKQYVCAYCKDSTFSDKVRLKEHLVSVHELKENEMSWKDVKCLSKPTHNNQMSVLEVLDSLSVAEGVKISCKKCNPQLEFSSVKEFAEHIRRHQDEDWNCSECSVALPSKKALQFHMRKKHSVDGMKCPDCGETFPTNRRLILHGISVHQKYFAYFHKVFKKVLEPDEGKERRVKNFECDVCQRKYTYKSSLRKHILSVHLGKAVGDSVACPYCGKKISNKLNLKSHIEFVHEALFVSCPICKKKINFRTIGKHYKTHRSGETVDSKNSYLCNLCGRMLKSRRSFEDHQKLHKNIRDELCDICGRGFTNKKFLRLHKKTHEGGERPKAFGCDQCGKAFSGKHTLNRHLLTHEGKKNFICEICSKCFYTLQELNRHVRYHKKEYRFDCQLCDMKFLDKSRFRHHMMRHRNVRPHKCRFCEKMFIVRGKMNLHMATKHNFEVENTKGVWKDPKTYVPLDDLL